MLTDRDSAFLIYSPKAPSDLRSVLLATRPTLDLVGRLLVEVFSPTASAVAGGWVCHAGGFLVAIRVVDHPH